MHSGYLRSVSMSTAGSQAAEPCGCPAARAALCQPALEELHIHTQLSPVSVLSDSFSSPKWMHKVSIVFTRVGITVFYSFSCLFFLNSCVNKHLSAKISLLWCAVLVESYLDGQTDILHHKTTLALLRF